MGNKENSGVCIKLYSKLHIVMYPLQHCAGREGRERRCVYHPKPCLSLKHQHGPYQSRKETVIRAAPVQNAQGLAVPRTVALYQVAGTYGYFSPQPEERVVARLQDVPSDPSLRIVTPLCGPASLFRVVDVT